jgi:GAF domain-containing protein
MDVDEAQFTAELADSISATARALFAPGSVAETLERIVDVSVATIDSCDLAGIFLVADGRVTTQAASEPLVAELDGLQFETDEGPCLDAISEQGVYYAGDLQDDDRWSQFGPRATRLGVRCLLAVPLLAEGTLAALNLYARVPLAYGAIDRAKGLLLATLAGHALHSAQLRQDEEAHTDQLQQALLTRNLIGQAQGIMMERERISADQAFDVLRRASQNLNIKLREVAQRLVESGEAPTSRPREGQEST